MPVQILVAANACSDDTVARMKTYQDRQLKFAWLPLHLIEVPTPGKSHALNEAIPQIDTELVALVDDDHRVDENHLVIIWQAAHRFSVVRSLVPTAFRNVEKHCQPLSATYACTLSAPCWD